jgi:hypothetical protein
MEEGRDIINRNWCDCFESYALMFYIMDREYIGPNYRVKFVLLFTGCNSSDNSVAKPSRLLNLFCTNN